MSNDILKKRFINKRKKQLKIIGFNSQNDKLMSINFKAPTGEPINIKVDFSHKYFGEINWGSLNKNVGERTSSNLYKDEFVDQLYWVIKIIKSGYNPNNVLIEEGYTVGHKKGRMDIAILDHDKHYFAVLDVKTSKAYPSAVSEVSHVQGQIPSYFRVDDTHIQYIGTITAHFSKDGVTDDEFIVSTKDWNRKGGLDEVSKKIKKSGRILKSVSLFGNGIAPYRSGQKILYINNLIPLGDNDNLSSKILNDFKNLIRRCGVSDTTNAYNKILNLLIAKIDDEHKSNINPSRRLHFINDNNVTDDAFMNNLNNLYEDGMNHLIGINNIGDNTDIKRLKNILDEINLDNRISCRILNTARRIRNKSDSNFLFKDVYNDDTYKDNVSVVRQVVDILYKYRFMHPKKSQFLGDFFENILDNGFKQNSGQYFTPIPIARYIMHSLPLRLQLYKDLKKGFIPRMVDFAVGSGHFLIEYMKSIQNYIDSIDLSKFSPLIRRKIAFYMGNDKENESKFQWANQCVYGIDIDYRLVKTAKINTYLNGDGKAHILCTNGLNKFSSPSFTGLLKSNSNSNNKFDFLISNPPYSVKNFKKNLQNQNPDKHFQLSKFLKNSSNKIELLFLERATQLVKTNGYLAIVLPSAIFTSPNKLYNKARQLLIKNFSIRSITILPRNTFMATGTQTVLLLARKINHIDFDKQENNIYQILVSKDDLSSYSSIFTPYINDLFNGNINLKDYKKFILNPSLFIKESKYSAVMQKIIKLYNDYAHHGTESWGDYILSKEAERIATFNSCNHDIVIISSPSNKVDDERKLLGYKFSKRRGHEGLRTIRKHHDIDDLTMLYRGTHNSSNVRYLSNINHDILLSKKFSIPSNLLPYVDKKPLYKVMGFRTIYDSTEKVDPFNTIKQNQTRYLGYKCNKQGQLLFLKDVAHLDDGHGSISKDNRRPGNIDVIGGGVSPKFKSAAMNRKGNVITVSKSGANAGYINYYSNPIYACSDCFTIQAIKGAVYSTKDLFHLLKKKQEEIYKAAAGSDQKHIYIKDLEYFQLPYKSESHKQ